MVLAISSLVFNAFKLDFSNLFVGESQIAVISVVASLCVVVLLSILLLSYKIKERQES
ncbi:hypothetical protein NMS_0435 [Nonlabens marinus S1-08]|uniref:Uncharacterized protein n=2 Tax=Nonlabens TaxID=363408 RepID=W8VNG1_9FLAO|nr:hypothetical protein NMS_0435 [Nonlabens marinus S1-08]